jgi:3,4-dihydroxy 2-butanone 4-phosphate synthase/GTP cyclohydrolase II
MHQACIPGDVFGIESSCHSDQKKRRALAMIDEAGAGVFVYVHPGKLDLASQVRRHVMGLQDPVTEETREGLSPELRDFGLGAQVLAALGISQIRLMTDNPQRIVGLKSYGLEVVERVALMEH